MRGARIEFAGVTGRYGAFVALHETNLVIEPGEFFALLGPSGSGKSTLLGAVTGFNAPSSGRVLINGADVTGVPPYKRNIGMVFQNYALFPFMTVFDNVAFSLHTRKVARAEVRERVERALAMVRLSALSQRLPRQLSGGQQQRVALARASIYDPPVLLMDEPLGALDKNLREELQDEIRQFHRKVGATVVYVTHDQAEAAALADRVAILNAGRLEQIGTPQDLYEKPCNGFVAGFLGEANRFTVRDAQMDAEGVRLETAEGPVLAGRCAAPGDSAVCVRPERISIAAVPGQEANCLSGTVIDAVFSTGSIRYRVEVGQQVLLVRAMAGRSRDAFRAGDSVHLGWAREDTLVLPPYNKGR